MTFRRTIVAIAALGLAVPVLSMGAAQAGSNLCPSNQVCIYADNGFSGLLGYRRAGLGLMNVSKGSNDKMSSHENKTSTNARWYHDANGRGRCVNMLAHRSDDDINSWDDDELTSWATNGSC